MVTPCFSQINHTLVLNKDHRCIKEKELVEEINQIPEDVAQKITTLDLSEALLIPNLPQNLSRFQNLQILKIEQCHQLVSLKGVEVLKLEKIFAAQCFSLKSIDSIEKLSIHMLDLSYCSSLPNLAIVIDSQKDTMNELYLDGISCLNDIQHAITELNKLTHLHTLSVKDTPLRGATPEQLRSLHLRVKKLVI